MISNTHFFSDTLMAVDNMIGNFVETAYHNFLQSNELAITALFTVYILWQGYRLLSHTVSGDLMSLTRHFGLLLIVYGLLISWPLYNKFFYNIFTNEPEQLAQVMVNAAGQGGNVQVVLDNIFHNVLEAADALFGMGGWGHFFPYVLAFIVLFFGSVLCIFALCLFIYAKLGMAIALALGPLFLLMLLWDSTKSFFNSWINKLVTLSLVPVIASIILAFMLSLVNSVLASIQVPGALQGFRDIAVFSCLNLVSTFFLAQVLGIAAALGNGMTLAGLRQALGSTAGKAVVKSSAGAARAAGTLGGKAIGKLRGIGSTTHITR